jgi:hypothetical protein
MSESPGHTSEDVDHTWGAPLGVPLRIAIWALAFRVASAILAFFANLTLPLYQPQTVMMRGQPSAFWDQFTRYDSGWYYQIARYGYLFVEGGPSVGVGKPGKIAYFPLYPLLMRYTGHLFGQSVTAVFVGGIVVSWTSFVLAMVALFYLAQLDLPRARAQRAVLLTAFFTLWFFFGFV